MEDKKIIRDKIGVEDNIDNHSWKGSIVIPKMWGGKDIFQPMSLEERAKYLESKDTMTVPNATLLAWSQDRATDDWPSLEPTTLIATFEDTMYAGKTKPTATLNDPTERRAVVGYNLCTDGAVGITRLPVDRHKLGYNFDTCIPFRMVPLATDDAATFLKTYMHRIEYTFNGQVYALYYTKRMTPKLSNISIKGIVLPDYPERNYLGSEDIRTLVEFPIVFSSGELVEYFRIVKGDAGATSFSSICIMAGKSAKVTHGGVQHNLCWDTVAWSKANFIQVPVGVGKPSDLIYQVMYL